MVLPSEASGGKQGTPELTSNLNKVAKSISKRETRERRQYYAMNRHLGIPQYMPMAASQRFYPVHQPLAYARNPYTLPYGMHEDPNKPRIRVHIETEKKNIISHTDEEDDDVRLKRQLFGMTSLMSPAQPIKSPLPAHGSSKENAKSEVPKHRNARDTTVEVPFRAEQHRGIFKIHTNVMDEGEKKKSTIQRIQRRNVDEKAAEKSNEKVHDLAESPEYEHAPIRKRQFVFNSEPPVVRATVKGEKESSADHSPIGNLIKMIAGHSAKNILGLNSKSFDVFPGPLPDTKDSSVWNIKSAEVAGTDQGNDAGQVSQAYQQPSNAGIYKQVGLETVDDSQRREEQGKLAEEEAEREKYAFQKEQTEMVAAQTAAKIQQEKLEEEKALEREQQIEQEQEMEQDRANEMSKLVREQANTRLVDMNRAFLPGEGFQNAVPTLMVPMQREEEDDEDAMAYPNQMIPAMMPTMMPSMMPSMMPRMMPIQPDEYHPSQIQLPMAAMAYQDERPMSGLPYMTPTAAPFIPTPPMMFVPTNDMMPVTEPPPQLLQDLENIHRAETAHTIERGTYFQHYPIHKPHHRRHWHAPTDSPFRFSNYLEPEMNEEDAKPEVHVHIQTEKSKIPQGGRNGENAKSGNSQT